MGLCYVLILGTITVLVIWSPLAKPETALSDAPMLMQLDAPAVPNLDPAVHAMSDMLWSPQLAADVLDDMPTIDQIVTTESTEPQVMTYNDRPLRAVKTMRMLVTAYSPDERSCGKWADGITASGYSVWTNAGKLVAADTHLLPFGSLLTIPGYNGSNPVPVLDRGGKIRGQRLDVLYPTHAIATRWGAQTLTITVWEYAD
jgi:3D (Asp-Asp-Asp) domain-containing protein